MFQRVLRFLKIFCIVLVILVSTAVGSLYYFINEKNITQTLERYANDVLHAAVSLDGKISFTRLPKIEVTLPALRLLDPSTEKEIASVKQVSFEVSPWLLALGAKKIKNIRLDTLKTELNFQGIDNQSIFNETFGAIRFPNDLKIKNLTVNDSEIRLHFLSENKKSDVCLTRLNLSLDTLSPEIHSAFETRFHFSGTVNNFPLMTEPPKEANSDSDNPARFVTLDGDASLTGNIGISCDKHLIVFDSLRVAAESLYDNAPYTVVVRADQLRFKPKEISGTNVSTSLSRPNQMSGDAHFDAVDFKYNAKFFASPELRFAYNEMNQKKRSNYQITTGIHWDFDANKPELENFKAQFSVGEDGAQNADFNATLAGFVKIDLQKNLASVGLSGDFAASPFTYTGTVQRLNAPELHGELVLGDLDLNTLPRLPRLDWIDAFSFDGDLRIGKISAGKSHASQLHANLLVHDGRIVLNDAIVNYADGRLLGNAEMNADGNWKAQSTVDGINLQTLVTQVGTQSSVGGIINGQFTATGNRNNAETVELQGEARAIRGFVKGIDADLVRKRIIDNDDKLVFVGEKASTALDEASAKITLNNGKLILENFVTRSVSQRTNGELEILLKDATVKGKLSTTFAPARGTPSVYVNGSVDGPCSAPIWNFDWTQSREMFARAQGRPLIAEQPKKKQGLWSTVKEFFRF